MKKIADFTLKGFSFLGEAGGGTKFSSRTKIKSCKTGLIKINILFSVCQDMWNSDL